jgi:hypothetical protein
MLGSGGMAPPFWTLALYGDEWSASSPYRFTPGQIASTTLSMGGWLGTRACLDTEEEKNFAPAGNRPRVF